MIEFTDAFGRHTIFDFTVSPHKNRIGFVIRKERQSIAESIEVDVARQIVAELQEIINQIETNNQKEN